MEKVMLSFDKVSAHYGKIQALHEVSLHINQGEIVTLIGANGAGKTTLLGTLCIARAVQAGIPLARVTLSSDGNGSQPFFDDEGNLTHIGVAGFETLLETVQVLVKDYDFSISDALRPLTSSVAGFLNLTGKGEILPGNDADLVVMTPELRIEQVYARGKLMVKDGKACVKGTFETA